MPQRRQSDPTTFVRCRRCHQLWRSDRVLTSGVCVVCDAKDRDNAAQSLLEALRAELEHQSTED